MKANELMVGDYLRLKKRMAIVKVEAIIESGITFKYIGGRGTAFYDQIAPIPLTPEILKKNGFKDGQFFAELYIQGWHVISDAHNLCMECERGWHMNIPCRCLHELQHAFNLVGINMDFAV